MKEQVDVAIGHLLALEVLLARHSPGDRRGPRGCGRELIEASDAAQDLTQLDGYTSAVALESINAVVRFTSIAVEHSSDGADAQRAGVEERVRKLVNTLPRTTKPDRLQIASHRSQRGHDARGR